MTFIPVLADFWSNPGVILVLILIVFALVALLVFLLRKYLPFFKNEEKEKTPEEVAEEEVRRLVVDPDETNEGKEPGEAHEVEDSQDDTLERILEPVEEEEAKREMDEERRSSEEGEGDK